MPQEREWLITLLHAATVSKKIGGMILLSMETEKQVDEMLLFLANRYNEKNDTVEVTVEELLAEAMRINPEALWLKNL